MCGFRAGNLAERVSFSSLGGGRKIEKGRTRFRECCGLGGIGWFGFLFLDRMAAGDLSWTGYLSWTA